jgi:hypothetical protein
MERKGIHTTEFWLTIASVIFSVLDNSLKLDLPKEPLYAIITYVLTRGWVKATKITK